MGYFSRLPDSLFNPAPAEVLPPGVESITFDQPNPLQSWLDAGPPKPAFADLPKHPPVHFNCSNLTHSTHQAAAPWPTSCIQWIGYLVGKGWQVNYYGPYSLLELVRTNATAAKAATLMHGVEYKGLAAALAEFIAMNDPA